MTVALILGIAMVAACAGVVLGGALGANKRADLEQQVAELQRRLLARYEEHA